MLHPRLWHVIDAPSARECAIGEVAVFARRKVPTGAEVDVEPPERARAVRSNDHVCADPAVVKLASLALQRFKTLRLVANDEPCGAGARCGNDLPEPEPRLSVP